FGCAAGSPTLTDPIVGIATAAGGHGYWLAAQDGGVFAFGDAEFLGSVSQLGIGTDVAGITPTPSHRGYWLVGTDGGVFSFGDATFTGSEAPFGVHDA